MNDSKPYPAPWTAEHSMTRDMFADEEDWQAYLAEKPPLTRITAADGRSVVSAHDLFTFDPANARLIAAAPDMAEIAQAYLAELQTLSHLSRAEHRKALEPKIAWVRAALSKAGIL